MHSRARVGFGIGNLLTAALLGAAVFMLPVRYTLVDALLVIVAVIAAMSAVGLLANAGWAGRGLRIAAFALLGFGLLAVGLAVLTLAFLAGVHGRWLDAGIPITMYALALIVPYTVIYPLVQLLTVGAAEAGTRA
jgi:hypothetical protein